MAASGNEMRYVGRAHFDASPPVVWSAMEEIDQFEHWWSWLGSLRLEGDGLRAGSVIYGTVSPPLPYRMQVRVELGRCVPNQLVDATVHGDLEGVAHLSMEPAGAGTAVEMTWTVEMTQRRMRVAARFAYPLLRWGHDRVVEATVRGFRQHVQDLSERDGV